MTVSPAGMLPPRTLAPCTWNTVLLTAAVFLFIYTLSLHDALPISPPFKLNVTEVKASDVLSVPPFRLNVTGIKVNSRDTVTPYTVNGLEGRLIWDVAGISNVPAL